MNYGECFVRHPYKQQLVVTNESKLPGKFSILPQDLASKSLAAFQVDPDGGGIPARG